MALNPKGGSYDAGNSMGFLRSKLDLCIYIYVYKKTKSYIIWPLVRLPLLVAH